MATTLEQAIELLGIRADDGSWQREPYAGHDAPVKRERLASRSSNVPVRLRSVAALEFARVNSVGIRLPLIDRALAEGALSVAVAREIDHKNTFGPRMVSEFMPVGREPAMVSFATAVHLLHALPELIELAHDHAGPTSLEDLANIGPTKKR